jgi:hypothetical protein
VNGHYPAGPKYKPAGDSIFPLSELSAFFAPNQVTCGYSETTQIFVDKPAMAEVIISLKSDDPSVLTVPATVSIPIGSLSTSVTVAAKAISGPFAPKFVKVHASYGGKTLDMTAEVVPPAVASVTLSPSTVVCGNSPVGTVVLNLPSLLGAVVVELVCSVPGFATVPAQVTIPQNQSSASFSVTVPNSLLPFPTVHALIYALYSGSSAFATLTITPSVIAGIVHSLTIFPSTVIGGNKSHGTVTLEQAVATNTVVALAAVEGAAKFPLPDDASSVGVPSSVTIPAGQTSAGFSITTKHLNPPTLHKTATIIAAAVVEKYAMLSMNS